MTKQELAEKINAGAYSNPSIGESSSRITIDIEGERVTIYRAKNWITAYCCISTEISEETFNKVRKQAMQKAIDAAEQQIRDMRKEMNAI